MRGSGIWLKHLNPAGWHRNGTERFYFRPKSARSPFPPEWRMPAHAPHHPAFLSAYAKAFDLYATMQAGEVVHEPAYEGSLAHAAVQYKASHSFGLLDIKTKASRRIKLDGTVDLYGKAAVAQLERRHILKDLSRYDGHTQRVHLKMWRHFAKWLVINYSLEADPTDGIKRAEVLKSDGFTPWTPDDVRKFRAHFDLGHPARLCFELLYWTGARISDITHIGRGNITDDGWLSFNQIKTGGPAWVPFARQLPDFAMHKAADLALLHDAINAAPTKHVTFHVTSKGASRLPDVLSSYFSRSASKAGLSKGKTAHGVRKLRAQEWASAGASAPQMMAWQGWESMSECQEYIKKFNRQASLMSTRPEQKSSNSLLNLEL